MLVGISCYIWTAVGHSYSTAEGTATENLPEPTGHGGMTSGVWWFCKRQKVLKYMSGKDLGIDPEVNRRDVVLSLGTCY